MSPPSSTRAHRIHHHWVLAPGARVRQAVPADYNIGVYVFDGELALGPDGQLLRSGQLAVLGDGDDVVMTTDEASASLLLLGGVPLREPVARYGPFVMNTQDELVTAVEDYRAGRLGRIRRSGDERA